MLVSAESSLAAPCDALTNSIVSKSTSSGFCQQQTHMLSVILLLFRTLLDAHAHANLIISNVCCFSWKCICNTNFIYFKW